MNQAELASTAPGATAEPRAVLKRNALLAAGGAALIGLGLAAGLAWRSPPSSAPTAAEPAAAAMANPANGTAAPATGSAAGATGAAATANGAAPAVAAMQPSAGTLPNDGAVPPTVAPAPPPPVVAEVPAPAPAPAPVHPPRKHRPTTATTASTGAGTAAGSGKVAAASPVPAAPVCTECGTVQDVHAVKVKGQGTGVGAVAGGALGGVVGNHFGHGNGRAAMTILGAVGGALAGNETERHVRAETVYDVTVRMQDGSIRTVQQRSAPALGAHVVVDGDTLRADTGQR